MIEDINELDEETKKEVKEARAEIETGKSHTLDQVEKGLGL